MTTTPSPKRKRTTVNVEFMGEQYDRLVAIKERMNGESFPSILRNFTFAYDSLQEQTTASLADGSAAKLGEMEQRVSVELREVRKELRESRRELNATAAMLESLVKLVLLRTPAPAESDRAELGASARKDYERVLTATSTRFDGERAKVLGELEDRVVQAQFSGGPED